MLRASAVGMLFLILVILPGSGHATTLNELKVAVRVVDFLANPLRGQTPFALLYDAQNKASADDAQAILTWLGSGAATGKAELRPILVDIHQLDENKNFRVGFIAAGMETHYGRIFDYARRNRTLTISADLSCVRAGKCTVGIAGAPRVEVIISQQAALSCGIEFTEAFRMMVTEN